MIDTNSSLRFLRTGLITIAALYFLILVGGIVRASGSGMGCPDWPTCFGKLIPPTSEAELPPDYHEKYVGYGNATFNVVKTWTEYVNRLIGVVIGFLILLTAVFSIPFRKTDPPVFFLAILVFFLVGFQGWLGSRVVATDLKPLLITAHMVTAFLIVSLLIYIVTRSQKTNLLRIIPDTVSPKIKPLLLLAIVMTLLQVTMGTQIRETIDGITHSGELARTEWRDHFPIIFYIHRTFSLFVLLTNVWLSYLMVKNIGRNHVLGRYFLILPLLVTAEIATGITLDRLGFPAYIQPVHLLLANLIFGCQFFLFIALGYIAKPQSVVSR